MINFQEFYTNKLQEQMDLLDRNEKDDEASELWGQLKPTIPSFFEGITIKPSLLHGDMWSGNVASIDGEPGKAKQSLSTCYRCQ